MGIAGEESLDEFEVAPESLQKSFVLVYRFVTENMPLLSGYMSSATVDWVCVKVVISLLVLVIDWRVPVCSA